MKRIGFHHLLALVVVLVLQISGVVAQSSNISAKVIFGQIEKIDLRKDGVVLVSYRPIEDFQYYMDLMLNDGKTLDVKTNNPVQRIEFRLNQSDDRSKMQDMYQKEGFNVIVVEPGEKKISMVQLAFRKFTKSLYIHYK